MNNMILFYLIVAIALLAIAIAAYATQKGSKARK